MKTTIKHIKHGLITTILLVLVSCASLDMAQNNAYLGYAYDVGIDGRKQDYSKAFHYYKLAAEENNSDAQTNLGLMYLKGNGVKKDYAEAYKYLKLGAAANNSSAQAFLGYMYLTGDGVEKNYYEGLKLAKLAASKNNSDAQLVLVIYYVGRGKSSQDNIFGFVWSNFAARQGKDVPITLANELNKKLTTEEQSIAVKVIDECGSRKFKIVECVEMAMLNNLTKNTDTKNIKTNNVNNIKTESKEFDFANAEKKCTELGFKVKSEKFADCVIKLSR